MDINNVVLIGRLTKNPHLSYTINGIALCKFTIAVQHKNYPNKEDKDNNNVSFFDVIIWDKLAENCHRYLKKSNQVAIEGYLKQNRYKSGNENRYKVIIVAQNVQFLTEKKIDKN